MKRSSSRPCSPTLAVLLMPMAVSVTLYADDPFDYFSNSWSVIGLRDYKNGTRITPDNQLLLPDKSKVKFRYGRRLKPLSRKHTKTLMDGWLPIVQVTARDGDIRYDFTFFASPRSIVKDRRAAFDWPTEGEAYDNHIRIAITNEGTGPNQATVCVEGVGRKAPKKSDLKGESKRSRLSQSLKPGEKVVRYFIVACGSSAVNQAFGDRAVAIAAESKADAEIWLDRTVQYWRNLMAGAARIEVPCTKATEALLAAHVCQLIAADHGELHGGEGFYDEFYIRDAGYQIMELEEAGLWDAVDKAMKAYLRSQRPDGRFETQKGQFDANGQAVWVFWQYYMITRDRVWLAKVYPQMRRAVEWTMKARRQDPAGSPFAGVLPNALADGEYLWNGAYHIVGYDLWNLRGMLCTADAARVLGKTDEAKQLTNEAKAYRAAIDAAWRRSGVPHFPPSWEKAGTHWGNTETLWPTELFAVDDPRVGALLTEVRQRHGGGFIEGTIQWLGMPDAIHPYMSAYSTMASLIRGEHETVVEDFYWYLLHSSATHAFPEGIFYKRRFAWNNTIPHVTGASNYALMLRHMLIHERDDELHLLSAVPDWWLGASQTITVVRAPTHFGVMRLAVSGKPDGVTLSLDPPKRNPPKRIVLHLPTSRPLLEPVDGVMVVTRADQKPRWSFDHVVARYREIIPPSAKPIPGLVDLPLGKPASKDACRLLDLTGPANTNPFTEPFGVPNPGKFLFTGMPVGVQRIGNVPFRIIDPAENSGKGFVILHSPKAPKNRPWPRQVTIPVGAKGKRLYFLGNVHGWGANDAGAGPWGAVAVYEIRYIDGQVQEVPLITGRTAEDWTHAYEAIDVYRGLEGDPWHLNVLGVELRPVGIKEIVFRDLGTVAAPLLAAVTLEK